jgi:hypothetical protein
VIERAGAQSRRRVEGVGRRRAHVAVVDLHAWGEVAVGEALGLFEREQSVVGVVAPRAQPSAVRSACSSISSPPASRQAMFVQTDTTYLPTGSRWNMS